MDVGVWGGQRNEFTGESAKGQTEGDVDLPRISLSLFVEAYDEITKARERNKKNIFEAHIRPGSLFSYLTGKIEFMGFWVEYSEDSCLSSGEKSALKVSLVPPNKVTANSKSFNYILEES